MTRAVAGTDRFEIERNGTIFLEDVELLANDADPDGDILRITSVGSVVKSRSKVRTSILRRGSPCQPVSFF